MSARTMIDLSYEEESWIKGLDAIVSDSLREGKISIFPLPQAAVDSARAIEKQEREESEAQGQSIKRRAVVKEVDPDMLERLKAVLLEGDGVVHPAEFRGVKLISLSVDTIGLSITDELIIIWTIKEFEF